MNTDDRLIVECPRCGQMYDIVAEAAASGRPVRCRPCNTVFVLKPHRTLTPHGREQLPLRKTGTD